MKKTIFWNMCLITLIAIFLSSVMTTIVYYNRQEMQMKREVITEARYLEAGMELAEEAYLDQLFIKIRGNSQNRITLIAQDGTVIFDSNADNRTMKNHGDRPEVKQALEIGTGEITRISSTLSEKTYYYAIRLSSGDVVRVANTTKSVLATVLSMIPVIVLLMIVVLIVSMVLAGNQTKRIVKPINELDLDNPKENRIYDELAPLISRVERQQRTIQKQMDTLKAKQREFAAITENMNEGFIVVGKKAEVASYNSSAMRILGIDRQYAEESGVNILNFNRSNIFRSAVDRALEGHSSEHHMDINGRCYQIIANPVMDAKEVSGAIIVILDVTEKQEREGLRREFSANVSHELKTPLTSISGYAEIMKNGLVKAEDMKRFSENIYHEAQRMIILIGDIIKLSRLDENQVNLEKNSADLYQIAEGVVSRLKDYARTQKIALTLEGSSAVLKGCTQILDEMIYNLCDNGIKYNRPGGLVAVSIVETGGHLILTVTDTGIGIPEADQERVFERFYRVDKSHSQQTGGTGLGLSIVKHGAIFHGARVEMESKEGLGTVVRVIF